MPIRLPLRIKDRALKRRGVQDQDPDQGSRCSMATIDLTTPEPDLIKVRLLARQLLDLVQPPQAVTREDRSCTLRQVPHNGDAVAAGIVRAQRLAEDRGGARERCDGGGRGWSRGWRRRRR